MTATAEADAPPAAEPTAHRLADGTGRVRCGCGAVVKPTRAGGLRPRPHLRYVAPGSPDYDQRRPRCTIVHPTETLCKRCGGTATQPLGVWRYQGRSRKPFHSGTLCRSPVFHIAEWTGPNGERYGNAAAAGAILGVSGEYFEYILRRYAPGAPSRPPEPIGIDLHRRYMYWDLDAVAEFDGQRPGLTASAERLAELREERRQSEQPGSGPTDQAADGRVD